MSNTNANIIILSPDNTIYQFFKYDGSDPSILGELLRQKILQSLGIVLVDPKKHIFSNLTDAIREYIYSENNKNGEWKNEGIKNINDLLTLNNNIDYVYLINYSKNYPDLLYYSLNTTQVCEQKTYKELITYLSIKQFSVNLSKKIDDRDDYGVQPF